MRSTSFFALAGFFALAAPAPVNRRDIRWITETALEIETAVVTETVWVRAGGGAVASPIVTPAAYTPKAQLSSVTPALPSSSSTLSPSPAESAPVNTPSPSPSVATPSPAPVITSVQLQAHTPSSPPPAPETSSTSSIYTPPPAPSTTEAPTPAYTPPPAPSSTETPTPAYTPPAVTPSAAPTTPGVSGLSYGMAAAGKSYTGDITYYQTGLGSCGINSGSSDRIVAISETIMDAYSTGNPNNNPLCNKGITIQYQGKSYPATVVDRCTGCDESSIDLSEGFFQEITGNTGLGRVSGVSWTWD